ncbi:MAG: hypothetical protein M1457_10685 [bacterium]|nr:hypothetical protein [bacterium]
MLMVIGAIALVTILLATLQGSMSFTQRQTRLSGERMAQAQATAAAIAMAVAAPTAGPQTMTLTAPGDNRVTATVRPLAPTDPLWSQLGGLAPRDGDELLTLAWPAETAAGPARQYIINRAGARRPVGLGAAAAASPAGK